MGPQIFSVSEDTIKRYESYGWNTLTINGHNHDEISQAIVSAKKNPRPTLIACKTKIGFGSPNKESKSSSHGSPLGEEEIKLTREKLHWSNKNFEVPDYLLESWRKFSIRNNEPKREWVANNKKMIASSCFKSYFNNILSEKVQKKIC